MIFIFNQIQLLNNPTVLNFIIKFREKERIDKEKKLNFNK